VSIDDLLFAIILAGIGLSVAYLRAEYVSYRGFKATEHKKWIVQRELHAKRCVLGTTGKCSSVGEGFGARLTHLHTRTQYSSLSDAPQPKTQRTPISAVQGAVNMKPYRMQISASVWLPSAFGSSAQRTSRLQAGRLKITDC
jgi:hypothetical protein